ncbi:MAG: HDIG domain-containing protein [Planctomycetes bacterium]|nr:HDIG domain-containing protein [Planctomycetota bacterium]
MVLKKKKISARRKHVRDSKSAEKFARISAFANSRIPLAIFILLVFASLATFILSVNTFNEHGEFWMAGELFESSPQIIAYGVIVLIVAFAMAVYVAHYQNRIIVKPTRMMALAGLLLILLALTKFGSLYQEWVYLSTGWAVTCAIILTIAYNQRFAIGMTFFFCVLASFAASNHFPYINLFLTMMVGAVTCCFSLREIRTRMKLIEVSIIAAVVVFITTAAIGVIQTEPTVPNGLIRFEDIKLLEISRNSGLGAAVTIAIGLIIQGFLPLIEKVFNIATSMTLLDYSDANQPLLKKLAMEAPGTFSHSLLIGTIAEAAADAIGANGLLCRVGAYYHDIGKINKPPYFVENQMGSASRHEQLSPAMSQLVIVGHVKDGIEIAKEYALPGVLRQFVETHHGTTLIEYFYNEAKKQAEDKQTPVSESEFRYPGPKPRTKEAAIVMLADTSESAVRSMSELTPGRVDVIVHNMAVKRLQDGQFDDCDLTLRELSKIEGSIAKSLAAHHHGRIAYPKSPDEPIEK